MRTSIVHPRELGPTEIVRWRELQAADPALDNPFLSPEFTVAVGELQERVRVAVFHDGADIVAFLPFERHPLAVGRPVAAGLTDAQGMVAASGLLLQPAEVLAGCRLDLLDFDHLVAGQPFRVAGHETHPSPVVDLSEGFDAYSRIVSTRSRKTYRTTLAKRRKIQQAHGPLRHEYAVGDLGDLQRLLRWKATQYRRTGRTDRFARPWIVELVQRLLATHATDFAGVLDMLYLDGTPIAGHFGLRTRTALVGWFPAYDPTFARYSPGLIQHLELIEQAAGHGITAFHLGRGQKEYKDRLKTGDSLVGEGRLARPSLGAATHWITRVPLSRTRNAVLANPRLRQLADRSLKAIGRIRTSLT